MEYFLFGSNNAKKIFYWCRRIFINGIGLFLKYVCGSQTIHMGEYFVNCFDSQKFDEKPGKWMFKQMNKWHMWIPFK